MTNLFLFKSELSLRKHDLFTKENVINSRYSSAISLAKTLNNKVYSLGLLGNLCLDYPGEEFKDNVPTKPEWRVVEVTHFEGLYHGLTTGAY